MLLYFDFFEIDVRMLSESSVDFRAADQTNTSTPAVGWVLLTRLAMLAK